jgi:hypothetical protein
MHLNRRSAVLKAGIAAAGLLLAIAAPAQQQTSSPAAPAQQQTSNPDAPATAATSPQKPDHSARPDEQAKPAGQKQSRIFGVIPNYGTVEDAKGIQPLSKKEKFKLAVDDSFDPYAYPVAGFFAGIAQAKNQYPSWGQGLKGYARRYAGAFADETIGTFMTEAIFPVALKQDPRYFRLGVGGFKRRAGYSISRIWITRNDSGKNGFNYSEIAGSGVAAGISNAYYPAADRTVGNTVERWGLQLTTFTAFNVLKEYWPDIHQKIFHKK